MRPFLFFHHFILPLPFPLTYCSSTLVPSAIFPTLCFPITFYSLSFSLQCYSHFFFYSSILSKLFLLFSHFIPPVFFFFHIFLPLSFLPPFYSPSVFLYFILFYLFLFLFPFIPPLYLPLPYYSGYFFQVKLSFFCF